VRHNALLRAWRVSLLRLSPYLFIFMHAAAYVTAAFLMPVFPSLRRAAILS